ncbi:anthranilate synthase component I family protein [Lactobacillaceae bacterium Melli_B4]
MKIENLKQYRHDYPFLPVSVSVSIDHFDPFAILNHFDVDGKHSMMFDQAKEHQITVIVNPLATITGRNGSITIERADGTSEVIHQSPIEYLNRVYQQHRMPKLDNVMTFNHGLIGYFSYDFARYAKDVHIEPVADDLALDDFDVLLPNIVINYNRETKQLTLSKAIASHRLVADFAKTQAQLTDDANQLVKIMRMPVEYPATQPKHFHNQFSLAEFEQRVQTAEEHIHAGDIFQLILSNPYMTTSHDSLAGVAQRLYQDNPSPYHFYFQHGDYQAAGASPETLIKKTGPQLFSYPLAGTRRRGHTQAEDDQFATELLTSEKELAEHNMLVDLGRNDLGRISEFGTVKVTKLRNLLKFSNVMHLGSTIESTAKAGVTPVEILSATLPAGTLSGAPKLSAMQIINRLEQRKRGIYGGGIGMLDFNGDMDICIGIRLAYQKGDQLVVHSGAGIVADSIANQEYHEFENKSRLMMNTIQKGADNNAFTN